jgi:phospholipid/cholesterol/gamma-HCH transport system substrate-binding protein
MKKSSIETSVGIFMFIGLVCIGYLTIHLGKIGWITDNHYTVYARFESVSGLKPGAAVEMAGVQIGQIDTISIEPDRQDAKVKMEIQKEIILTDDVIASVKTAGLIGDKYIMLSPGGSNRILKDGDLITETESAVDLESLISKYVFGSAE